MSSTAMSAAALLLAAATEGAIFFEESFHPELGLVGSEGNVPSNWIPSQAVKSDGAEYAGKWAVRETDAAVDDADGLGSLPANYGLFVTEANQHYAITAPFEAYSFESSGDQFVLQYTVRFTESMKCGGSYVKLLSAQDGQNVATNLAQVKDDSPYTILFGPDKCGPDAHLRFIFNFRNPTTGNYREVHAKKIPNANELLFSDTKAHLLTLIIKRDNTFSINVDEKPVLSGRLGSEDEFEPALHPAKTINDPDDKKPDDWVDDKEIFDPEDIRPDDWVTEAQIADPEAEQPEGWDDEMDGEWEAPQIKNPAFKGDYKFRKIENPTYKGIWEPKQLENPEYFKEDNPFAKLEAVDAIAFELWTTTAGIAFDDIFVGDEPSDAHNAARIWRETAKHADLLENKFTFRGIVRTIVSYVNTPYGPVYAIALLAPIWFLFCRGSSAATEDGDGGDESDVPVPKKGADSSKADADEEDDKVEPEASE